jgi:hypothetical protein
MGKRNILLAAAAAVAIAAAAPAAQANVLTAPQGATPPDVFTPPLGITPLAKVTGPFTSNFPNDFSGTYTDEVFSDPTNVWGAGDLTFLLTVTDKGSSTNSIGRVTESSFAGWKVDAGYYGAPLNFGIAPSTEDRNSAAVIGFDFSAGLTPGSTTDWLVIETNATSFTSGNISVLNAGVASVAGLAPTVPEPATWAMMLLGFAGLGLAGFRARKESISIA